MWPDFDERDLEARSKNSAAGSAVLAGYRQSCLALRIGIDGRHPVIIFAEGTAFIAVLPGGQCRRSAPKLTTLLISMTQSDHLRRIRFWLAVFIIGLVLSGITAFPLETELSWLVSILHAGWLRPISEFTGLLPWIERVYDALRTTNAYYPFLAYGTDWLAFAHLVDRNCIHWSLHRSGPQQVGYHFRADRLRWSHPACSHRRRHPWHSVPMASYRLQLRTSSELSHSCSPGNQSMLSRRLRGIFRLLPRAVKVWSHGMRESFIQRTFGRRAFGGDPGG